jgi:hypothetical protein
VASPDNVIPRKSSAADRDTHADPPTPTRFPLPSIFGNDSAKGINITPGKPIPRFVQVLPWVPLCADELPCDSVAELRGKVDGQTGRSLERHSAGIPLLHSFVKKIFSNGVRACA